MLGTEEEYFRRLYRSWKKQCRISTLGGRFGDDLEVLRQEGKLMVEASLAMDLNRRAITGAVYH